MSEWKKVRLGEICYNFAMGPFGSNIKTENFVSIGVPIIKGINMNSYRYVNGEFSYLTEQKAQELHSSLCFPGDLVFTHRGTIGQVCLVPEHKYNYYIVSQSGMKCSAKKEIVSNQFLLYFFKSPLGQYELLKNTSQVGVPAISSPLSSLKNVILSLPPLEVQNKIVYLLSSLDDKIELNNRMNRSLEEQAQAVFREWFVDNAKPEWKEGKLKDIGTIVGGSTPSKEKTDYFTDDGIAWITPKDLSVSKNKFTAKGETDITETGYKNSSAQRMPRGTVLFSSRAPIGYISIAKNEVCTNQGFKSIIPNKNIGAPFVYYFLKENTTLIENKASGSTFKEASGSLMKSIGCVIPDDNTLTRFNSFCEPLFAQQERLEEENEKLSSIRDTLLPKLMKGEINI